MKQRNVLILIQRYAWLLRLYPSSFRDVFCEEMQTVFEETITTQQKGRGKVASLFLRELFDLPGSLLDAYLAHWLREGNLTMNEEYNSPSTRRQAFWGILPFLAFGISSMIGKVDHIYLLHRQNAEMAVYGLALVGYLIGWIRGFPLWSYSYLGWSLLLAWSNTNVSINGIHWGYQVWIPFGITILTALLWTHSLTPLKKLLRDCWNDWTRLSLAMFAFGGFVWLIYDENHHPNLILFMLASTLAIASSVWFFLRSSNKKGRILSIISGFMIGMIIDNVCSATWDFHAYYGLIEIPTIWYTEALKYAAILSWWGTILFWPVLVGFIRGKINRRTV